MAYKELTPQEKWDRILLQGWNANGSFWMALQSFSIDTWGEEQSFSELERLIVELQLKRCPLDVLKRGAKMPIRAVVENHCEILSRLLWAGNDSTDEILKHIDAFKWKNLAHQFDNKAARKRTKGTKTKADHVVIRARSIKDKHDWGTIK